MTLFQIAAIFVSLLTLLVVTWPHLTAVARWATARVAPVAVAAAGVNRPTAHEALAGLQTADRYLASHGVPTADRQKMFALLSDHLAAEITPTDTSGE